ncbi:hypothetical protein A3K86_21165 [Photobacterium jeanii]|uniref:Lipoprotein n=1 Tax=Photobacterium jeanii TaxID=858640 RepID=A0A178K425_9GAMM|nr:hypothetical protein [Photobacterium jeanii]OAN11453.1 hypothetical protein A3K86_21165 [Photobacterium jeanii]PST90973.1 hypothetical protein C9I91_10270 [Photobacterium jeanii]
MKNFKLSVLPVAAAIALVGCGGGDAESSFDEQKVTYDVENIVESFLGKNIDYATKFKTGDSDAELVKYYDKNGNVVDFKFPTNTTAKFGCKADPISLDNKKFYGFHSNPYFNIKPLTNGQKLVVLSSFPTEFTNKYIGNVTCSYDNYSFNKKYIIGSSNQKIIELKEGDKVIPKTNFMKLSVINRLYNVKDSAFNKNTQENTVTLKPYADTIINQASHEFIVNENGEVKTYDITNQQYITLPDTKGTEWLFFSNDYLVSKEYGGKAFVYDIKNKQRLTNQYINVLQNKGTDLLSSNGVTISYGLIPLYEFTSSNHYFVPFKYVTKNGNSSPYIYVLINGKWVEKFNPNDDSYKSFIGYLDLITRLNNDDNSAFIELTKNLDYNYISAKEIKYNSGFELLHKGNETSQHMVIKDFPNNLVNALKINNKVVIETAKDDIVEKERKFYFVYKDDKNIIGAANEKLISVEASASN